MRLTQEQVRLIVDAVSRWAGTGAEVYLFGSRLNDTPAEAMLTFLSRLTPRCR